MTSSTEDCLNSDLTDGKALETLIMRDTNNSVWKNIKTRKQKMWQGRDFKIGERYLMQQNLQRSF